VQHQAEDARLLSAVLPTVYHIVGSVVKARLDEMLCTVSHTCYVYKVQSVYLRTAAAAAALLKTANSSTPVGIAYKAQ